MRPSLPAVLFLTLVLLFSIFIANISNLIAVRIDKISDGNIDADYQTQDGNRVAFEDKTNTGTNLQLKDTANNLMWFVQISDIHISIFNDETRISQFKEFCDVTLNAIKPPVVLATGDLTDAKTPDNIGSTQQIEEWEIYRQILDETKVREKTIWLDIRGNHDNFNIPSPDSNLNFYRNFTVQGKTRPHSYLHVLERNGYKYGFLGIDACLTPGPKRPFNFIGMLNYTETAHVKYLLKEAKKTKVNYTVAFGHYPTSCIISKTEDNVRYLISQAPGNLVYLCGHFHTLGGMVPNMYTLQKNGFLELELGDWKDNRLYRVAAIDHGRFSFVDAVHGQWPVVLVTNPKHALYVIPNRESLTQMLESTHIRVLAFSPSEITSVRVKINEEQWRVCKQESAGPPLYTTTWTPADYKTGVHMLHVHVTDTQGRESRLSQPFSLDGTNLDFRFWPRIVLMSNISVLFQSMFGVMMFMCVAPLCLLRMLHHLVKKKKIEKPKLSSHWYTSWIRRMWILSTIDRLFYPLIIYSLYLSVGPWTVGEVIDGHVGVVFAWGVLVNHYYLPGSFTYAYGFMQLVTFQIPLIVSLSGCVDRRFKHVGRPGHSTSKLRHVFHHTPFFILLLLQMLAAYFFWLAYGTLAFIIGPLRTWSIVLALVLWYMSITLPPRLLTEASFIWSTRSANYLDRGTTLNSS